MAFRRRCTYAWMLSACLAVLVFLVLHLQMQSQSLRLQPLPGTYQYFHEIDFHSKSHRLGAVSHCDARYALPHGLDDSEFRQTLLGLMHSYASTMKALGIETWLAHGTLLGWYWNHRFLPWDTDIDVQMSEQAIIRLATEHNMTEFEHQIPQMGTSRKYLLDINPHYKLHTLQDVANKIDGRWIDLTNGKFIDITALHAEDDGRVGSKNNLLFCKDGHRYNVSAPTLE